jgi:hypothetical protein
MHCCVLSPSVLPPQVEDSLFQEFDVAAKQQLNPMWNRIGSAPKQLLQDMRALRKLLMYLLRYF